MHVALLEEVELYTPSMQIVGHQISTWTTNRQHLYSRFGSIIPLRWHNLDHRNLVFCNGTLENRGRVLKIKNHHFW